MNIIFTKNDDGFLAKCPNIQWAFAEWSTKFEAFYNLVDVLKMISEIKWIKVENNVDNFNIPLSMA